MDPFRKVTMFLSFLRSECLLASCMHRYVKEKKKSISIAVSEQLEPRSEAVSCTAMSWTENVLLIVTDTHNYTTELCEHEVAKELNISLLPDWRLQRYHRTE